MGMISSLLVFQLGQARVWFAMSRDGLLPRIFSRVHKSYRTPDFSTWVAGVVVGVPAGLLDIGGGSSEFIIGKGLESTWTNSFPIGAVNLTQQFTNDPPSVIEALRATALVREAALPWAGHLKPNSKLFGVAGTVTTLAGIERELDPNSPESVNGIVLEMKQIKSWRDRLLSMSLEQRQLLKGMPESRAEIIHAGALILAEVMEVIGRQSIAVSDRGVIFGLAMEMGGNIESK